MDIIDRMNQALEEKKITKWEISRSLGVSWLTVYSWQRRVYKPNPEREISLDQILKTIGR